MALIKVTQFELPIGLVLHFCRKTDRLEETHRQQENISLIVYALTTQNMRRMSVKHAILNTYIDV